VFDASMYSWQAWHSSGAWQSPLMQSLHLLPQEAQLLSDCFSSQLPQVTGATQAPLVSQVLPTSVQGTHVFDASMYSWQAWHDTGAWQAPLMQSLPKLPQEAQLSSDCFSSQLPQVTGGGGGGGGGGCVVGGGGGGSQAPFVQP
jgi:hypothetical protein